MFIPQVKTREGDSDPMTDMFEFWVSFWPVAPLFGVKWRFADMAVPVHGNLAARPGDLARAGAEVEARAVEEAIAAPAVAEPVAEKAAEKAKEEPALKEPAIEETMEPRDPAESPGTTEPERQGPDPQSEARPAKRPKGLRSKAPANPDDLKLIKGIGPSLERQLNDMGLYTFEQIAKLGEAELAWVDDRIETVTFKGRCFRDDWVGQAKAQLAEA